MAITLTTVYAGLSSTAEPVLDVMDAVAARRAGSSTGTLRARGDLAEGDTLPLELSPCLHL